jgi:hypothetical protein
MEPKSLICGMTLAILMVKPLGLIATAMLMLLVSHDFLHASQNVDIHVLIRLFNEKSVGFNTNI